MTDARRREKRHDVIASAAKAIADPSSQRVALVAGGARLAMRMHRERSLEGRR
jgi:hypothetical protein